ncbi:MAG: hypothetical protein ACPGR7_09845 [Flavobacteriaceae bacterium]
MKFTEAEAELIGIILGWAFLIGIGLFGKKKNLNRRHHITWPEKSKKTTNSEKNE